MGGRCQGLEVGLLIYLGLTSALTMMLGVLQARNEDYMRYSTSAAVATDVGGLPCYPHRRVNKFGNAKRADSSVNQCVLNFI